MKTFKGDYSENLDDFADEIVTGCKKMGFKNDEEEMIRFLRGSCSVPCQHTQQGPAHPERIPNEIKRKTQR